MFATRLQRRKLRWAQCHPGAAVMPKRKPHHFAFEQPSGDTDIRRYSDFPKFVSVLHTKALFFARADKLGDPLEGTLTRAYGAEGRRERGSVDGRRSEGATPVAGRYE